MELYQILESANCCFANNQDCTPCRYKEYRGNGCVGRLQKDMTCKLTQQGQELAELKYKIKKVTESLEGALEVAKE